MPATPSGVSRQAYLNSTGLVDEERPGHKVEPAIPQSIPDNARGYLGCTVFTPGHFRIIASTSE